MQQYLPFMVLKRYVRRKIEFCKDWEVATVLTVYGIETYDEMELPDTNLMLVATVLTVYGIETVQFEIMQGQNIELQQYLPFMVLKLN